MSEQLLISINEQLGRVLGKVGGIEARLDEGSKRHAEFASSLQTLEDRTDKLDQDMETTVKPMAKTVAEHSTTLSDHAKTLKKHGQVVGRFAAVMGVATGLMYGAVTLIWWGVQHFGGTILDLLRGKGVS